MVAIEQAAVTPRLTAAGIERRVWRVRDPAYGRGSARAIELGLNIAAHRKERGWSQARLARALGGSPSTVSRWESGDRLPALAKLFAIGRALGCGAAALLPNE